MLTFRFLSLNHHRSILYIQTLKTGEEARLQDCTNVTHTSDEKHSIVGVHLIIPCLVDAPVSLALVGPAAEI